MSKRSFTDISNKENEPTQSPGKGSSGKRTKLSQPISFSQTICSKIDRKSKEPEVISILNLAEVAKREEAVRARADAVRICELEETVRLLKRNVSSIQELSVKNENLSYQLKRANEINKTIETLNDRFKETRAAQAQAEKCLADVKRERDELVKQLAELKQERDILFLALQKFERNRVELAEFCKSTCFPTSFTSNVTSDSLSPISSYYLYNEESTLDSPIASSLNSKFVFYPGFFEWKKSDQEKIVKILIDDFSCDLALAKDINPALVLFKCLRFADKVNQYHAKPSAHDFFSLVVKSLIKTCQLINLLRQYGGSDSDALYKTQNTAKQNGHCLRSFNSKMFAEFLDFVAVSLIKQLVESTINRIEPLLEDAIIETGLGSCLDSAVLRNRTRLMSELNALLSVLTQFSVDKSIITRVFNLVLKFIAQTILNQVLSRPELCNWTKAIDMQFNLSVLADFLRENGLRDEYDRGVKEALLPLEQTCSLLQYLDANAEALQINEIASGLSIAQVKQVLSMFSPLESLQSKLSADFVTDVASYLEKARQSGNELTNMNDRPNSLLQVPFVYSSVELELISVPAELGLEGFLE